MVAWKGGDAQEKRQEDERGREREEEEKEEEKEKEAERGKGTGAKRQAEGAATRDAIHHVAVHICGSGFQITTYDMHRMSVCVLGSM